MFESWGFIRREVEGEQGKMRSGSSKGPAKNGLIDQSFQVIWSSEIPWKPCSMDPVGNTIPAKIGQVKEVGSCIIQTHNQSLEDSIFVRTLSFIL